MGIMSKRRRMGGFRDYNNTMGDDGHQMGYNNANKGGMMQDAANYYGAGQKDLTGQ